MRRFIGDFFSMLVLSFMALGLVIYEQVDYQDVIFEQVRLSTIEALEFIFPDYFVQVGEVGFNEDVTKTGWLRFNNISLLDVVEQREVQIREFRFSPAFWGTLLGGENFKFVEIEEVQIDYKFDPPMQDQRLVFPINLFDIPASVLTKNGHVRISEMKVNLQNSQGVDVFSIDEFEGQIFRNYNGYEAQLRAREAGEDGAFSIRSRRIGEKIIFDGNAREYHISLDPDLRLDFDLGLEFNDVPAYDLTEQSDNALRPYQYLAAGDGFFRVNGDDLLAEARYEYDETENKLLIPELMGQWKEYNLNGKMTAELGDIVLLEGTEIVLTYPGVNEPIFLDNGYFLARVLLQEQRLDIARIAMQNDWIQFSGNANVVTKPQLVAGLNLDLGDIAARDIVGVLPQNTPDTFQNVLNKRVDEANLINGKIRARYHDEIDFMYQTDIGATAISPVGWSPLWRIEKGSLTVRNETMQLRIPEGWAAKEAGLNLRMTDIELASDDVFARPVPLTGQFQISGDNASLYQVFAKPPIDLEERTPIKADQLGGKFEGQAYIEFLAEQGVTLAQTDLNAKVDFFDLKIQDAINGQDISSPRIAVTADETRLVAKGSLGYRGISTQIEAIQGFTPGSVPRVKAQGSLSLNQLASLGVKAPEYLKGQGLSYELSANIQKGRFGVDGQANMRNLGISVPVLGQVKAQGQPGNIAFNALAEGDRINIDNIDINLGSLAMRGRINIADGQITNADFPKVSVGKLFQGEVLANSLDYITLRNAKADIRGVKMSSKTSNDQGTKVLRIKNFDLVATDNITLTDIYGDVVTGSKTEGSVRGRINGGTGFDTQIWTENGLINARLQSNDAGGLLRSAGLYRDLSGGNMDLRLRTTDQQGLYAGKLNIKGEAKLKTTSTSLQLLEAASIFGLFNPGVLTFTDIGGDVLIYPSHFEFYSGHAYGPSMGVTIGGAYNQNTKSAALRGVLTPAYLLNGTIQKIPGLGKVLGGNEGEGFLGMTYSITGRAPNYNIGVNPLSLLTPGVMREIWGGVPQSPEIPPQYRIQ